MKLEQHEKGQFFFPATVDTNNMGLRYVENFLDGSEVARFLKKE